jgi:hypothetical protein
MQILYQTQAVISSQCGNGGVQNQICRASVSYQRLSEQYEDVPSSTRDKIATLMCFQAKMLYMYILYPDVQQQGDSSSCGLYALDYAMGKTLHGCPTGKLI